MSARILIEYERDGRWVPVPDWASYFFGLGMWLAMLPPRLNSRLVMAYALPLADWSAIFLATGFVCIRATTPVTNTDNLEWYEYLKSWACGTPVKFLHKGKLLQGRICDDREGIGEDVIPIQVVKDDGKNHRFICRPSNCARVDVLNPGEVLSLKNGIRGLRLVDNPAFVKEFAPGGEIDRICLGTRLDYVIIGHKSRVLAESHEAFRVKNQNGDLGDVVRLKRQRRDYRGVLQSATVSTRASLPPNDDRPALVIHESAAGYLRHNSTFKGQSEIILLDRSERSFNQTVQALNQRFLQRSDEPVPTPPPAPDSLETMVFCERTSA